MLNQVQHDNLSVIYYSCHPVAATMVAKLDV